MDLFKIGSTIFKPLDLIEGWNSLIWTERFRAGGDFELKTYDVENTLALLPIDPFAKPTLVGIKDSREVMIVETHEIDVDDDGVRYLTTKGRSFETFLEQRTLSGLSGTSYKMVNDYSSYGAVEVLLYNAFVETSVNDVVRGLATHDPNDAIPNVSISQRIQGSGYPTKPWWLESDYVYPKVLDFLSRDDLGIRNIRPNTASAFIVTVGNGNSGTTMGNITRTTTADVTDLLIEVYDGVVRTKGQSAVPPVIFSEAQGHIDAPKFLFSNKNLKNTGFGTSSVIHGMTYSDDPDGTGQIWSGLKKRTFFFDASNDYGSNTTNVTNTVTQKLELKVKRRRKTMYLDGEIDPNSPYQYGPNKDYFLGDKVSLLASYGIDKTVRVTEYIRIHDEEGDRGFPTLAFDGS